MYFKLEYNTFKPKVIKRSLTFSQLIPRGTQPNILYFFKASLLRYKLCKDGLIFQNGGLIFRIALRVVLTKTVKPADTLYKGFRAITSSVKMIRRWTWIAPRT